MIRTVLCLALLAAPAIAGDPAFDPRPTEACLAEAEAAERAHCFGRAAEACMDQPGMSSTVGMTDCLGRELSWWDGRLNEAFRGLMELEKTVTAEMRAEGSAASDPAAALRDMQRAWIGWRDAACLYERSQWGEGTGGGPAYQDCAMRITATQALGLENRLAERQAR